MMKAIRIAITLALFLGGCAGPGGQNSSSVNQKRKETPPASTLSQSPNNSDPKNERSTQPPPKCVHYGKSTPRPGCVEGGREPIIDDSHAERTVTSKEAISWWQHGELLKSDDSRYLMRLYLRPDDLSQRSEADGSAVDAFYSVGNSREDQVSEANFYKAGGIETQTMYYADGEKTISLSRRQTINARERTIYHFVSNNNNIRFLWWTERSRSSPGVVAFIIASNSEEYDQDALVNFANSLVSL